MDLATKIQEIIENENACEIILRVSRYGHLSGGIGEPEAWQCIVKFQDAKSGPWGVGIRADPIKALEAALRHRVDGDSRPEDIFG